MKSDSGITISVWMAEKSIEDDGPLDADTTVDVCIVGAGIAGMATAYFLSKEGKSVAVLDDGEIGGTMTSRTTAHLVNVLDDRYHEIERLHGEAGARMAAESHTAAIDAVQRAVRDENIDCEFERLDGYLFVPPSESIKVLEDELAACHRAGISAVEWVERAPFESFDTGRCLRFREQAQFHPLKFVAGLAKAVRGRGARLHSFTHATTITGGDMATVETNTGFTVTARLVVVATNTPVNDRVVMHTKQAGYITYVIGLQAPKGRIRKALFWDTPDPYHYVRLANDPEREDVEILIVGGEDHKTGQADDTEERFVRLEEWARKRFPSAEDVTYRWSGQVMEPIDGMAYIGRNPWDEDNVFIATGDSGNGMTHGLIAGMLLTDLIAGRENGWAKLYDPGRTPLRGMTEFLKENVNVAAQYTDLVTGGDVDSPGQIKPGEGAVIRDGLKKLAVYRNDSGDIRTMSAVCPHVGCIVTWNGTEKTWDCPCHGSRFDREGAVFQGPANADLDPVN